MNKFANVDSLRIRGYNNIFTDSATCISLQKQALTIAKEEKDPVNITKGYAYLTLTYTIYHQFIIASLYADSAMVIGTQYSTDECLGYSNMAIGMLKANAKDKINDTSLNYLFNAYFYLNKSKIKDYSSLIKITTQIAAKYCQIDFSKAKKYIEYALLFGKMSGNVDDIVFANTTYSYYLALDFDLNPDSSRLPSLINNIKQMIDFAEKNESKIIHKRNLATLYLNLASCYLNSKQPRDTANYLYYNKKAIEMSIKYDSKAVYRNAMINVSEYYIQNKDYARAEMFLLKSVDYQKKMQAIDNYTMAYIYEALKRVCTKKNDFKKYYEYDTSFLKYEDIKNKEALIKANEEADVKYEFTINLNKIEALKKENELQHIIKWLGFGVALLFFTGLLYMIRFFYVKKKLYREHTNLLEQEQRNTELELELKKKESLESLREKLSMERKMLQAQMDPHFVFNVLSNIQGSLLKNGSARIAINHLNKFSNFMRQTLVFSKKEKIQLKEEIELLKNYIIIQQLRFDYSFEYEINDNHLLNEDIMIPPMLIQPFIENAIEHGLKSVTDDRNKKITVTFCKENEDILLCTIEDNGIGIETSKKLKQKNTHTSLALQIVRERMHTLFRENPNISFKAEEIIKNGIVCGTKILLAIPCL